jgi:hypothetical protein
MRSLAATTLCLAMLVVSAIAVAGQDDSDPVDLGSEVARLEAQLAAVTGERDALLAEAEAAAGRYEKAKATQQLIYEIIADPAAHGTEKEVLDLLDGLAAPGTVYGDDAFGSTGWRTGWRNTLFADVDATIHTWLSWLSDDGSVGGSMWTWSGSASNGEPFDLQGIELSTYDEGGLLDSVTVYYPYEDAEVKLRFSQGNEAARANE